MRSWLGSWLSETWAHLHAFQPRDVANVLWALVELRVQPPPAWLDDLLAHTSGRLAAYKPEELSITL
jgi:hypothetical protein